MLNLNVPLYFFRRGCGLTLYIFRTVGSLRCHGWVSGNRTKPASNRQRFFSGLIFVLQPLAIKWACGGSRHQDLSQIEALVVGFPEDAERAELTPTVAAFNELASGLESLPQIIGVELNGQQVEQLCVAALSLNIDWVTPEQFIMGDERGMPDEQEAAWANFWGVVEDFQ
jgi:hypothetical protein